MAILRVLVALVTIHSVVLGLFLLIFPAQFLGIFRFPPLSSLFFPRQSGVFLILTALAYLLSLFEMPRSSLLLYYIVIVKLTAFVFLLWQFLAHQVPLIILPAGLIDGLMGLSILIVAILWWKVSSLHNPSIGK